MERGERIFQVVSTADLESFEDFLMTGLADDVIVHDLVTSLPVGVDLVQTIAAGLKRECWLLEPATQCVVFRFSPGMVVLH